MIKFFEDIMARKTAKLKNKPPNHKSKRSLTKYKINTEDHIKASHNNIVKNKE